MELIFYVYQLRVDGYSDPFYVGKGKGGRIDVHFSANSLKSRSKKNSIIKNATANGLAVHREILFDGLSEEEAFDIEYKLIWFHGRLQDGGCLANMTLGGEGISGMQHSAETKRAISSKKTGVRPGAEARKKMSSSHVGKKLSAETRSKMSSARKGKKRPPQVGQKVSAARRGIAQPATAKGIMGMWARAPDIWLRADEFYRVYETDTSVKAYSFCKKCGVGTGRLDGMLARFSNGWQPTLCPIWEQWSKAQQPKENPHKAGFVAI